MNAGLGDTELRAVCRSGLGMQPAGVALQRSHPVYIIDDYFREARLPQSAHGDEYSSHNTTRLDVAGTRALLLKLDFMQPIARGERVAAED